MGKTSRQPRKDSAEDEQFVVDLTFTKSLQLTAFYDIPTLPTVMN